MTHAMRDAELARSSELLEHASAEEIVQWAAEEYGDGLAVATAFGAEGCVLLDILARVAPNTFIFNLDTGYQFPETLDLREAIQERYGLTIHLVRPGSTVEEFEQENGGPLYSKDSDRCCAVRKVAPLEQALQDRKAWLSAIRRDQTRDRSGAAIAAWDSRFNLVKVSPLARWTKQQVWKRITERNIPYNPLHDAGYPSIGCWPCTHPVQAGEDERSGRWQGTSKTECGLHSAA